MWLWHQNVEIFLSQNIIAIEQPSASPKFHSMCSRPKDLRSWAKRKVQPKTAVAHVASRTQGIKRFFTLESCQEIVVGHRWSDKLGHVGMQLCQLMLIDALQHGYFQTYNLQRLQCLVWYCLYCSLVSQSHHCQHQDHQAVLQLAMPVESCWVSQTGSGGFWRSHAPAERPGDDLMIFKDLRGCAQRGREKHAALPCFAHRF